MRSMRTLACSTIRWSTTPEGFEESVALDCYPRSAVVWPKTLKRDQLMREQRFHIRAVQLRWVRAVVYQHQRSEFMMTQHSRLPSCRSFFLLRDFTTVRDSWPGMCRPLLSS